MKGFFAVLIFGVIAFIMALYFLPFMNEATSTANVAANITNFEGAQETVNAGIWIVLVGFLGVIGFGIYKVLHKG